MRARRARRGRLRVAASRAPVEDRTARRAPPPRRDAAPAPPRRHRRASPRSAAPTYTVKRGDTLHKIALDNGLDYRELAAWNNIENPNLIRVGQVLRLARAGRAGRSRGARPA